MGGILASFYTGSHCVTLASVSCARRIFIVCENVFVCTEKSGKKLGKINTKVKTTLENSYNVFIAYTRPFSHKKRGLDMARICIVKM